MARLVRGGSSDVRYARVTFDRVRARMLEAKATSEEQFDAFDRAFDDPLFWFVDGAMVGAWGRKPAG